MGDGPRGPELAFRAYFLGHPRGLGFRVEAYVVALGLGLGRRGDGPFVPTRVHFASARKGDVASIVLATGTTEIDFGADTTGFTVSLDHAERTIANVDPLLGATAEKLARDALVSVPRSTDVARAVDARILAALLRIPEAEEIARAIGMSERTLQRRLEAEGTRFSARIDGVREAEARRRTRDGDEPLATIAIALGFGDVPAFSRAFQTVDGHARYVPPLALTRVGLRPSSRKVRRRRGAAAGLTTFGCGMRAGAQGGSPAQPTVRPDARGYACLRDRSARSRACRPAFG